MHKRFDEMPIYIQGRPVGMFWGTCEIDVSGVVPVVDEIKLDTDDGTVTITDYEIFQYLANAILKHFEHQIADEVAEIEDQTTRYDRHYGRLLPSEML